MDAAVTLKENQEVKRLKLKCNAQIDAMEKMLMQLEREEEQKKNLQEELEKLSKYNQENLLKHDELAICVKFFRKIVEKAYSEKAFIPYKNYTKNSTKYLKIEKEIFDAYVEELQELDKKDFFEYCIDMNLLKSDENRKCIFYDTKEKKNIRIYFISKALAEKIIGEPVDIKS